MNELTFYERVIFSVHKRLGSFSWYNGACLKGLDHFEKMNDLDGAIEHATSETIREAGEL